MNETLNFIMSIVQITTFWLVFGFSLTKILNNIREPMPSVFWAWVPVANLWVVARIGGIHFGWTLLKIIVITIAMTFGVTFLAIQFESLALLAITSFLVMVVGSVVSSWFFWQPVAERGNFENSSLLGILAGVPFLGIFIIIYIAWKGDWS